MRSDRYKNAPTVWYKQFWGWVIIAAFVIGVGGIIITSIFDNGSTNSSNTATSDTARITDISKAKGSFDGHTAKLPKYSIKIRKVSIGENNDGDKCIVFDYTTYNKSAKRMTASDAWEQTFDVCQPDKNTQNQLVDEVDVPDSISDEMNQEINKGGHARGEYIAILKSTKRPVVLKAHDDSGNSIGEHKYKFKIKASSKNASSKDTTSQTAGKSGRTSASSTTSASKSQSNQQKSTNTDELSPAEKANVAKGLYPDGTRRPETFKSADDYDRYNAWHSGYNYDPSTGSLTPLNDQDMAYMRAQMNKDGGQSFQ